MHSPGSCYLTYQHIGHEEKQSLAMSSLTIGYSNGICSSFGKFLQVHHMVEICLLFEIAL